MSNMSYCRFENTLGDLEDCFDNMSDEDDLSEGEKRARLEIIELAKRIISNYGHEIGFDIIKIEE